VSTSNMKETIMTAARGMVQAQGYNALSFRELAKAVGIKSSSIHYYFPTKDNLGAQLAHQYTDDFLSYLTEVITSNPDWKFCIDSYINVFRNTLLREIACA